MSADEAGGITVIADPDQCFSKAVPIVAFIVLATASRASSSTQPWHDVDNDSQKSSATTSAGAVNKRRDQLRATTARG